MDRSNWDDLRFVIAVAEHRTLSAAARALGVNHATVLRRVQAFEEAQGGPVFSRTGQGYEILPDRQRVIDAARDVAGAVETVSRLMRGATAPMRGTVRISATDTFCTTILPKIAARIMAGSEGLRIEVSNSNTHADFARMQADIAVRPTTSLPPEMRGELACGLGFAVYAAPGAADGPWLGLAGPLAKSALADWMARRVDPSDIGAGADSFVTLRDLARQGLGRAILPCILGDATTELTRHGERLMEVPIWVASHVERADSPRLRLLRGRLVDGLREQSELLAGMAARA